MAAFAQLRLDGGEDTIGGSTRKTDDCMSPPWVADMAVEALDGEIDLDGCSHPQSLVPARRRVCLPEDGLLVPREGLAVYTNPPFSDPLPWAQLFGLARAEVFLIRIDTTTKWWATLWERSRIVVLLRRRVAFGLVDENGLVNWGNAAMWSCAVFGAGAVDCRVLAQHGYVARRVTTPKRSLRPAKRLSREIAA